MSESQSNKYPLEIKILQRPCDDVRCTYCDKPFECAIVLDIGEVRPDYICRDCVRWADWAMGGSRD